MSTLKLAVISLFLAGSCVAQQWSGIIATSRAPAESAGGGWVNAGISGGIPSTSWNKCGSTVTAGTSAASINSSISGCAANTYLLLGAGTFNLTAGLVVNSKSGIEIRGSGASSTLLVFTGTDACHGFDAVVCFESSDLNYGPSPSNTATWSAGYSQNATTITLSSVTNLKVGNPLILDQTDDTSDNGAIVVTDTDSTLSFTSPGIAGPFSLEQNGGGAHRSGREQMQIVTVASCDSNTTIGHACSSGTNITISPGLYMPNWSSGKSPGAWWATSPIRNVGIGNVSIDATNSGDTGDAGIEIFNCDGCWSYGNRIIDTGRAHIQLQFTARFIEASDYQFLTKNSVSQSYGTECFGGNDLLVYNTIYQAISSPMMVNGSCSGSVFAYNFTTNNYYSGSSGYNIPGTWEHTAGIDNVLFEGNNTNILNADVFHGTHHFVTHFRNMAAGIQPACWISGSTYSTSTFGACNNNLVPVQFDAFDRFHNMIGNVLGKSGTNTTYKNTGTWPIYGLGDGDTEGSVTVPTDPNVASTIMIWGNWDVVTNAVRWCGNSSDTGWGTTCSSTSEVPTGLSGTQAPFLNTVPSTETLPASFFLSSKPVWWPSGKAWPPIGPDVTGGNISGTGGHAYTIPSQDCYLTTMSGASDGTGGPYAFNAATCYPAASGNTPTFIKR